MNELIQKPILDPLTDRELEILTLIARGLTNQEIAEKLFLALETIRWYTKRIYSKMHVSNRTQAAARARELGLIKEWSQVPSIPAAPFLPKHNLPAQVTPIIGRESELEELVQRLNQNEIRLITILAPGGMGKTRLAVQIAKACLPRFSDGVFFIPLEQLSSSSHIPSTIAESLKTQLTASDQPDLQLIAFLRNKEMLLVMDSIEHLLKDDPLISRLLQGIPGLKVLVTSREHLGLHGEMIYRIHGLELPQSLETTDILESSAVRLFVQSAQLARSDFSLSADDFSPVVRICQLLEGMPLGIILAAAWIEVLSLEEIADEIALNLDFLKTERLDVPDRHRSIRAVFEHSLQMLQEDERTIFFKLSVFHDGFTRQAAESIAGAKLEQLAQFVRKSLLQYDPVRRRYRLHELLRQYAAEKLNEKGLIETTYLAHMNYYAELMEWLEVSIKGSKQIDALNQVQSDFENIRYAWRWAISQNHSEVISSSLECLYWFCNLRGRVPDGAALLHEARNRFLDSSNWEGPSIQRRLLLRFDASGGDYKTQLEKALQVSKTLPDKAELAFLLWAYGVNGYAMQDFDRAVTSLEESLVIYQELGDPFYRIEVLHLLWICTRFLGNHEAANKYHDEALGLSRKADNKIAIGRALGSRGAWEFFGGNYTVAEILIHEALDIRREIGDNAGVAMSMAFLGWLASIRGEIEQGRNLAESSLQLASEIHNLNSRTTAMNALGWIACLEGNFADAKHLCEESKSLAPDPTVVLEAEIILSFATCGLGDYQISRKYLKNAFAIDTSIGGQGLQLCLPVMAIILVQEGKKEQAAEIIAYTSNQPTSANAWMEAWEPYSMLKGKLEYELDQELFQLSWERGKLLELEEVVNDFFQMGIQG
jgi:predicted ATPase/DNA-binding CsgD family transcriptional regulator